MLLSPEVLILSVAFFSIAVLYSSVGHAGASGYLATMALLSIAPATMRPTALALNVLVAALATYRFRRAGWTRWDRLLPFVVTSVPLAYFGGRIHLATPGYRSLLGAVLVSSAVIMIWRVRKSDAAFNEVTTPIPRYAALGSGAAIGLLSGLTGTGGGIFLSPLLLFAGWAGPRGAAGLAAPFILVNSLAGLAGFHWSEGSLPTGLPVYCAAVLMGGWIGSTLGVGRLSSRWLMVALAAVLFVAGGKLLLT